MRGAWGALSSLMWPGRLPVTVPEASPEFWVSSIQSHRKDMDVEPDRSVTLGALLTSLLPPELGDKNNSISRGP